MRAPDDVVMPSVPEGLPTLLRDLVHDRTGVFFDADRFDMMLEKLRDRVLFHNCQSYLDYYYILKYQEHVRDEWLRVMDAFSVQETYFWRELSQIQTLATTVAPQWLATHSAPLKIWSAACASGEEPYSIVMALLEAGLGNRPIHVVASDASEAALEKARRGIFRERSFRALPEQLRRRYFTAVPEGWQLSAEVMRRVKFQRANLISPAEIDGLADAPVVFCRNVFIYFSPDAIRRTLVLFAHRMPSGGKLFVGSSESLLKLTKDFELTEIDDAFVYTRQPKEGIRP